MSLLIFFSAFFKEVFKITLANHLSSATELTQHLLDPPNCPDQGPLHTTNQLQSASNAYTAKFIGILMPHIMISLRIESEVT